MEDIFNKWPTLADLARDLGKPYQTVAAWKQRGSIPAKHDLDLVRLAGLRGEVLTLEAIAKARAVQATGAAQ